MKATAVNLDLPWGALEGLHWSRPGAPRVLCLHGWLDNAASFIPLSGYLEEFDVLALDFAGHGLSDHRPPASQYYFSDNLFDIDLALRLLGWEKCHFIGHSMGAGVASNFAAAMPEMVGKLVLLDAIGSYTQPPGQAAKQLRRSIKSVRKSRSFLKPYASVEDAMKARQNNSPLTDEAAYLLCQRALKQSGGHYQWRTDPRLNWRSPQLLSDDQALELLAAIASPTLVMTSPALVKYLGEEMFQRRLAAIQNCHHIQVDGNHHFHMEQAEHVGSAIRRFLQEP